MSDALNSFESDDQRESCTAMQARAEGTNVNDQTLLATDYLNHFNEVVMLLEMVPDMPEILEDVKAWQPKDYKDHFRDSTIADKDLAIEAYDHVPPLYKEPFEKNIEQANRLILSSVERLETEVSLGDPELLRANVQMLSRTIQRLLEMAGGNIHGSSNTMDQSEIDSLIG